MITTNDFRFYLDVPETGIILKSGMMDQKRDVRIPYPPVAKNLSGTVQLNSAQKRFYSFSMRYDAIVIAIFNSIIWLTFATNLSLYLRNSTSSFENPGQT